MIGGLYGYLAAAILVAATLGATYYKGHSAGGDSCRAEWLQANAAASAKAEAERAKEEQLSRSKAAELETALTKQKGIARDLRTVAEAHIRAIPKPPPGCPEPRLTDDLVRVWNQSNDPTAKDAAAGVVLGAGLTATPVDRPKPAGDGKKSP